MGNGGLIAVFLALSTALRINPFFDEISYRLVCSPSPRETQCLRERPPNVSVQRRHATDVRLQRDC